MTAGRDFESPEPFFIPTETHPMNGALKALAAASLMAAGIGNALAASNDGLPTNGTGTGAGDLMFAYEAADGQSSIIWDLSNGADDLTWTSILSASAFTISNPGVASFVTANPGGRWNLFGLTNTKTSGTGSALKYDKAGYGLTIKQGAENFNAPNGNSGGKIEILMDNNAAWISAANAGGLADNGSLVAGAADPWQFSAGGTHSAFIADQNATGLVGETLAYWTILIDNTVTRGLSSNATNALGKSPVFTLVTNAQGQAMGFTFNANGDLSYAAAAPVPVPGAVWLMGSAIAGLAGLRRRKA